MTGSDGSGAHYVCDNCGEPTHGPLVGGECIRKCSNSIPITELEQLADEWRQERMKATELPGKQAEIAERMLANCTDELQELIADYRGDTDG